MAGTWTHYRRLGIPKFRIPQRDECFHVQMNAGTCNIPASSVVMLPKGHRLAAAENLTPTANKRRLSGLMRAWDLKQRRKKGERIMTVKQKLIKRKRKRVKLRTTVIKEAFEIQRIARTHAVSAMNRLAKIINSDTSMDSVAVGAAIALLDRGYGKASQVNVNATVNADGKEHEISGKQLDERIATALKRVEDIAGRAPRPPESPKQPANLRKLDRDPDSTTHH